MNMARAFGMAVGYTVNTTISIVNAVGEGLNSTRPASRVHKEEKDYFAIRNYPLLKVAGVTFEGRQTIIRALKGKVNEEVTDVSVALHHMPTKRYPNRIAVMIDDYLVGYVSDDPECSVAERLVQSKNRGYTWKTKSYTKVGCTRIGLRINLSLSRKCDTC